MPQLLNRVSTFSVFPEWTADITGIGIMGAAIIMITITGEMGTTI